MAESTRIYFYGHSKGPYPMFSNFYPAEFDYEGHHFHSSEQALMYGKAIVMGDQASAQTLLRTTKPAACKALGRKVTPYDDDIWAAKREAIMADILECKFGQDAELKALLLKTGTAIIAEASPRDRTWGIGIGVEAAQRGRKWNGTNLLGKALMEARKRLNES
eukprot:m.66466 g.66466  ORF g.66466 m.66466 type:complete len:163 (-) comp14056_c0_seq1:2221-2709(-)